MDLKRKRPEGNSGGNKKKKYQPNGAGKTGITGPGVYVTCIKGKENQTAREIVDVFESIASTLWPDTAGAEEQAKDDDDDDEDDEELEGDIEKQLAKELEGMKKPRPNKAKKRFANIQTDTACLLFISCRPPVEPIQLVLAYLEEVEKTGIARTRFALRFDPVSVSSVASMAEVLSAGRKLIPTAFPADAATPLTFRIDTKFRHHGKMQSKDVIDQLAKCVPPPHKVSLKNPDRYILVTAFQVVAGLSVLPHYERLKKYNVAELVGNKEFDVEAPGMGEGRKERVKSKEEKEPIREDLVAVDSALRDDPSS